MRIDIFSIFPQYLDALNLSLIGKAREKGILDVRVKDLRDFATDKHRTVDDTPYGGGAGMVMKPEPWALALESTLESADSDSLSSFDKDSDMEEEGAPDPRPILLIPSPAGRVFDQALAYELSEEPHLLFACGRYEGIDERVFEWARQRFRVLPVSLGDYVLNGGEVAVLAMIEAIGRLIPGVVGNPMSLVEESHSDDLLEYPVYTKPSVWRGYETPEVLLGGHHGLIQEFRRREQLRRTADRRPDLLRGRSSGDLSKTEVKLLEELGYSRDENGVLNHSPEKIQ